MTDRAGSESQVRETRMMVRASSQRPMKLSASLHNREVIDAGDATPHEAALVELRRTADSREDSIGRLVVRVRRVGMAVEAEAGLELGRLERVRIAGGEVQQHEREGNHAEYNAGTGEQAGNEP